MVIPLVGRLALFWGGLSVWSSMRNSLLMWVRRVDFLVGPAGFPFSLLGSFLGPPGWGGDHVPLLESG